MIERRRRFLAIVIVAFIIIGGVAYDGLRSPRSNQNGGQLTGTIERAGQNSQLATEALGALAVKGRSPKTGYTRAQFGDGWQSVGNCDVRNHVLRRYMTNASVVSATDCSVQRGTLHDPYTDKIIEFTRGKLTSGAVQIDHMVALSDAWQKGAQQLPAETRRALANDPLNLMAVDGPANQKKADGDAATWLPPNKPYRCRYIARQIAVKLKYRLWITASERDAMRRILGGCPEQVLPVVG